MTLNYFRYKKKLKFFFYQKSIISRLLGMCTAKKPRKKIIQFYFCIPWHEYLSRSFFWERKAGKPKDSQRFFLSQRSFFWERFFLSPKTSGKIFMSPKKKTKFFVFFFKLMLFWFKILDVIHLLLVDTYVLKILPICIKPPGIYKI